jgi:hypothetical protein
LTDDPDPSAPPAKEPPKEKRLRKTNKGFAPFVKGEGGRRKGVANKTTRVLKELIILAADKTGSDGKGKDGAIGYLSWLARKEPAVFGNLLGKVLPLQLQMSPHPGEGDPNKDRYSATELREQLIARGLRVPTLIDVTPTAAPSAPQQQEQQEQQEDEDVESE